LAILLILIKGILDETIFDLKIAENARFCTKENINPNHVLGARVPSSKNKKQKQELEARANKRKPGKSHKQKATDRS
jgi:hypothetical protein